MRVVCPVLFNYYRQHNYSEEVSRDIANAENCMETIYPELRHLQLCVVFMGEGE